MSKDVQKRDTYKNAIARVSKFLNSEEFESSEVDVVEVKLKLLESYWEKFLQLHTQIQSVCGENELPFQEIEFENVEREYTRINAALSARLRHVKAVDANSSSLNLSSSSPSNTMDFRLPKLDLPKFHGDYTQWNSFYDLFKSIVDNNTTISSAQKFHYLKMNVIGDAARLITNYKVTDANYTLALSALKNRYDNKRMTIRTLLKMLLDQPPISTENSASLRSLIDTTNNCVRSLADLGLVVSTWHPFLEFLVTQRLDPLTARDWENTLKPSDLPTVDQLSNFIESRCRSLEVNRSTSTLKQKQSVQKKTTTNTFHSTSAYSNSCVVCSEDHRIFHCPSFIKLDIPTRIATIKSHSLCTNCFCSQHTNKRCKFGKCKICHQRHNTLLHLNSKPESKDNTSVPSSSQSSSPTLTSPPSSSSSPLPSTTTTLLSNTFDSTPILLATACIYIDAQDGSRHIIRALLDTGSQSTFISEHLVQKLQLKRNPISIKINGLGESMDLSRSYVQTTIRSQHNSNSCISISALVISRITTYIPDGLVSSFDLNQFNHLQLADQFSCQPGKIDLLIGSDIYGQVILDGLIRGTSTSPLAQQTIFGWILSGPIGNTSLKLTHTESLHSHIELENLIKNFWTIEEVQCTPLITNEQLQCEDHFKTTFKRDNNGRYTVMLPLNEKITTLGDSKNTALSRFSLLERRLQKNIKLNQEYSTFLKEYQKLGHMKEVTESNNSLTYYIPHHPVFKPSSTSTKLRVVFDASCKTNSGASLNDALMVGPKLQDDIHILLLRFRKYRIGITADVTKMYRQIMLHETHQDLHRIFWRESPDHKLTEFRLCTVTYGTASAPFLAVRAMQQCAMDHKSEYPIAHNIVMSDFYVDDMITGAHTEQEAIQIVQQVTDLLDCGGFPLCKWTSNNNNVLESICPDKRELNTTIPTSVEATQTVKTLGIIWHTITDEFSYQVNISNSITNPTKRNVLAKIASLYDPLGWIAPVIIKAKIFMQQLWLSGVNWDEILSPHLQSIWSKFEEELHELQKIRISRWFGMPELDPIQLHGFCDASEAAYAAVIYIRYANNSATHGINLVAAKTRVAPVKQITLPRLELCGAVLLSRLFQMVQSALKLPNPITQYAWTDSNIVLSWLQKPPSTWKTFIANRTAEILSNLEPHTWRHVPGKENPADIASRGTFPKNIQESDIWWHGPTWLKHNESYWPNQSCQKSYETTIEKRLHSTTTLTSITTCDLIHKYSNLKKLLRITAYCKRFINNAKSCPTKRFFGQLSSNELDNALLSLIKQQQSVTYPEEIKCLQNGTDIPRRSHINSLNPIIDETGLLRVGGRLKNADLSFDKKHQIILPIKSNLTNLFIADIHLKLLHSGTQLMLAHLRDRFWLPRARQAIRHQIYKCLTCFRHKAKPAEQLMGDLPKERVSKARAFLNSGVDYAGPIPIRLSPLRNSKIGKAYICVFVCLATKAAHLEAVGDLSTAAYMAAFRRFVSRRGICLTLMSDNGTNFIGAKHELHQLYQNLQKDDLPNQMAIEGTQWKLICPSAPHQGGMWEATVKSVKHHLHRAASTIPFTTEELQTLLAQIEACLNSRPLCRLTDDPTDEFILTPGHFLIGEPIMAVPEIPLLERKISLLKRWQIVQWAQQDFWSHWQQSYIHQMQQRTKWRFTKANVKIGDLVLLSDDKRPPTHWPMARIINIHPGRDNLVRVVSIKYRGTVLKRPIQKLCLLPFVNEI